jgi:hypothetical protein
MDNRTGVPVDERSMVGPLVPPNQDALAVHDDISRAAAVLKLDQLHVQSTFLQLPRRSLGIALPAADDSEVHPILLFLEQGVGIIVFSCDEIERLSPVTASTIDTKGRVAHSGSPVV